LLIDTSVAVALREGDRAAVQRLGRLPHLPSLSVISVVELEGGVAVAREGEQVRRRALDRLYTSLEIIAFGEAEAVAYARIVATIGFSRRLIIDRMIAAQAIVAGVTLATLNPRDFRDVPGLTIEDWSA
jgi:predicted nucleic acid-binding protein